MAALNDRGFESASEIGNAGEVIYTDMLEEYKERGKIVSYLDLTDPRIAQLLDYDFVVFTKLNGEREFTIKEAEEFLIQRGKRPDFCRFIEIKTDTRIKDTGNVYIEWIAHNVPGCFSISRADNWIYFSVDEENVPLKAWSIDFRKLREQFTCGGIKSSNYRIYTDTATGNYGYLIKIDFLVSLGVAKEIKL